MTRESLQLRVARTNARPLRVPLARRTAGVWERERRRAWAWVVVVVAGVVVLHLCLAIDETSRTALGVWAAGAGITAGVGAILERDRTRVTARHDESGLPSVAGWRLVTQPRDLASDPELARDHLALDLLAYLYETTALERRPIRGHPRGGARWTYRDGGLRDHARRWAASTGCPVRRGDALLHRLRDLGVIRTVRLCQVEAYRFRHRTLDDAICHLERSTGRPIVRWDLGRDPRAAGGWTLARPVADPDANGVAGAEHGRGEAEATR